MPRFQRPCLKCGSITHAGESYCPTHLAEVTQARERKRTQDPSRRIKKKLLYNNPDYRKARQTIVEHVRQYGADCHLCKQPINPYGPIDVDHLIPGSVSSPLAPTHPRCNRSRGNR